MLLYYVLDIETVVVS